ncbi:unnamed protein product [Symbiodinium microadriaticum]|nr:unnamed protein product [Symbiodinium microadriaticum]
MTDELTSSETEIIPEGFHHLDWVKGFGRQMGPMYHRDLGDGDYIRGFRVLDHHLNGGGMCHGGMLMSFADISFGHVISEKLNRGWVTVRLTTDFAKSAMPGDWVEGMGEIAGYDDDFCTVKGRLWALAHPMSEHRITVRGCEIVYHLWGDQSRPGLMLVHGNGAHSRWWQFIAPFFTELYQVAAINLSGMGESGWRDSYNFDNFQAEIHAAMDDAGFFDRDEKPVLCGHSFGGFCTTISAAKWGEELAAAVIVDSPIGPRPNRPKPRELIRPHRIYPSVEAAVERFRLAPPQPCANQYLVEFVGKHSLKPATDEDGTEGFTWRFDPQIWRRFATEDMEKHLANLQCPAAIIYGEHSDLLSPELAAFMSVQTGGAPRIAIPDARHHVMLDQPLAFVATLRGLLATWPGQD